MARPLIVGNWKMNTTIGEARELVARMKPGLAEIAGADKVLCPPFTALGTIAEMLDGTGIGLGAQDMYSEASGAFTGEVSPAMVAELCQYVILGHSERRQIFAETDDAVGRKAAAAQQAGLKPIVCVGESLAEREAGAAEAVIERQLLAGLVDPATVKGLAVAYEPVWAIGTGRAASPGDAQAMMGHIRHLLVARYGAVASDTPLLYGGSVTDDNVADFVTQEDIGGALVGGVSLKPETFVALVRNATNAG